MIDYAKLVREGDLALKAGQAQALSAQLLALRVNAIPPAWRLEMARLCRRTSLFQRGLEILSFSTKQGSIDAVSEELSMEERAEYAALLAKGGSVREALYHLRKVDAAQVPEAHLFKAFCHIDQWNHVAAKTELEAYLATAPEAYASLVAQVNLGSVLIACEEFAPALAQLDLCLDVTQREHLHRLHGNCLELKSQAYIQAGEPAQALAVLEEAAARVSDDETRDRFYIEKWRAIALADQNREPDRLMSLRKQAAQAQHWESVRDLEFHMLRHRFETDRYQRLLFGTPHFSFRERLQRFFPKAEPAAFFDYGRPGGPRLDLRSGDLDGGGSPALTPQLRRLFQILMSDLYAPIRLGELFSALFPDEHFNVFTSPNRVNQILWRSRQLVKEEGWPVQLDERGGAFRVRVAGPFLFRMSLGESRASSQAVLWEKLAPTLEGAFSSRDLQSRAGLSLASCQRLLQWAIDEDLVERSGAGKATRYRRKFSSAA